MHVHCGAVVRGGRGVGSRKGGKAGPIRETLTSEWLS